MTPQRKTGLSLVVVGVSLLFVFGLIPGGFAVDYPLLVVLAVLVLAAGAVTAIFGGKKKRQRV